MKLNFEWRENKMQYQSGESLCLNKIKVGGYVWNSTRSRDEPRDDTKNYVGQALLPQATKHAYGESPDKVRTGVERIVTAWFKEALK